MLLHAALVVAYAALALGLRHIAAEALGPDWRLVPEVAVVAFLAAATIHLLAVVVAVQRRADRGFAALQASQRDLRQDIEAARVASQALQETLGRGAEGREGERAAMGEVVAEVKVLQSLVSDTLALAPLAVQETKKSLNEIALGDFDLMRLRAREQLTSQSADFAEGRAAFAERRKPVFTGR